MCAVGVAYDQNCFMVVLLVGEGTILIIVLLTASIFDATTTMDIYILFPTV